MRIDKLISHLLLALLLAFTVSGVVSAKVASGLQNLGGTVHPGETVFNPLMHLAKIDISYGTASGSPVVTKGTRSVDDLIKGSKPGGKTRGRTSQFDRSGGFNQANKDFDALGPKNVKDIDTAFGPGRTGTLPDGRQVNVRPGSSNSGPPTLEIQQGKNRTKFRFK